MFSLPITLAYDKKQMHKCLFSIEAILYTVLRMRSLYLHIL